jgi:hypothetical protein
MATQGDAEFEQREEDVLERNTDIERRLTSLESTLAVAVQDAPVLDYDRRFLPIPDTTSVPSRRHEREPVWEDYSPREPGALARLVPGWEDRHESKCEKARAEYEAAHAFWENWTRGEDEKYAACVAEIESRAAA